MDTALKELASSGALGAIVAAIFSLLAIVIGVLVWALKRYVDTSIEREKEFGGFMKALTSAFNAVGLNTQACRSDTMAAIRDAEANLTAAIEHTVWAAHDKAMLLHDKSLAAATSLLSTEITGAAQSIRARVDQTVQDIDNMNLRREVEISRAHNITPAPSGAAR